MMNMWSRRRRAAVQDRGRPRGPAGAARQGGRQEPRHHGRQDLRQHQPRRHRHAAAGRGAQPRDAGKVEIVDLLVRLGQALDEQNIPETGPLGRRSRHGSSSQIKMSELRDASLTGDGTSILRNGRLGMVDRFTIYVSNLLPSGVAAGLAAGEWVIYAGTSARADVRVADQQGRDAALRADFRAAPARPAGVRLRRCSTARRWRRRSSLRGEPCPLWNSGQISGGGASPPPGRGRPRTATRTTISSTR